MRFLTVDERWEQGIPHAEESKLVAHTLDMIDRKYGDSALDLCFGGDGDSGEHLLYLLDIFFEIKKDIFKKWM